MDGHVHDDGLGPDSHGNPHSKLFLKNQDPEYVSKGFIAVFEMLQLYGWFILVGVLVIFYLYHKFKPAFDSWRQKQHDWHDAEEAKKNPDKFYELQLSMEQARLRLQQQVQLDADKKKAEKEKKEEEKRHEKIQEWEKLQKGQGYHSKFKPPKESDMERAQRGQIKPKKKDKLRSSDYNPLTGQSTSDSSSCSWRPGRRNVSGGG